MYFHAAMVHHQDIGECRYKNKSLPHIDNDGFNCNIDQQVITFPFIASYESIKLEAFELIFVQLSESPVPVLLSVSILSESRGPPNA